MVHMPQVLVVGAGPTGLTMAHELAREGVACRVIDKSPARSTESKAIAIHARTLETFALMRLADRFLAAGARISGLRLYGGDHERIAHVDFSTVASPYPFVLSLAQSETERMLEEGAAQHGVRVDRGTELVGLTVDGDAAATVRLRSGDRTEECRVDWVIGCDGPHNNAAPAGLDRLRLRRAHCLRPVTTCSKYYFTDYRFYC